MAQLSHKASTKPATEAQRHKDNAYLRRNWREWRSAEVQAALAGPHGVLVRQLLDRCRGAALWTDIQVDAWLAPFADTDRETEQLVRGIVHTYVSAMRETVGLPPFDDPLDL